MYHRASELKHIFNENMKGGTGTVEIIRSVNPIAVSYTHLTLPTT